MQQVEEVYVKKLFEGEGELQPAQGNTPWEISNTHQFWTVDEGYVELFLFDPSVGIEKSRRTYLLTVHPGELIPKFTPAEEQQKLIGILAVGGPNTSVRTVTADHMEELLLGPNADILYQAFETWVVNLGHVINLPPIPKASIGMEPNQAIKMKPGQCIHSAGDLIWLGVKQGDVKFVNVYSIPITEEFSAYPLGPGSWVSAQVESIVEIYDTNAIAKTKGVPEGLKEYHQHIAAFLVDMHLNALQKEKQQILEISRVNEEMSTLALDEIAGVMQQEYVRAIELAIVEDPYMGACHIIGKAQQIDFRTPPERVKIREGRFYVDAIARASGVRNREVTLYEEWWKNDSGPMLGFTTEGKQPVALMPARFGGYNIVDPATNTPVKIDDKNYGLIEKTAYVFYRPFPDKALTGLDILKFAFKDLKPELWRIAIAAVAIGLLGLLTPIITNQIFSFAVPDGERALLLQFAAFLAGAAIATGMIQVTQSMAVLRIDGRAGSTLQAALWDRLLGMPTSFFRRFSSGELASRALSFDSLRNILTGTVIRTLLTLISSIFSFGLLFKYDLKLALVALSLVLVTIGILTANTFIQINFQKKQISVGNKLSGFVFQLLSGIAKLRIAGTESRALDKWSILFAKQKNILTQSRLASMRLNVFNAGWDTITKIVIFWFMATVVINAEGMATGKFIAFQAAFGQFFGAMLGIAGIVATLVQAGPTYKQTKPILDTLPEVTPDKIDPGELQGKIEIVHAKFRYEPDLPLVLDDVSMKIEPGEYVALVGPTGAGKSSILRLILGFDKPEAGAVYFDGQDLQTLDVQAIRRQIGVVIQNAKISPGDIFTNIVGSLPYTLDDAWHAAEMSGLSEDIKRMPMGMHTYISEDGSTLSGGQKQRLIIARALIGRPRILLFDEATSALDNYTQAVVTKSVEALNASRFAIAHRLSTIEKADRIYVLSNGQFVQQGTFAELMQHPGLFQELAKRQIA